MTERMTEPKKLNVESRLIAHTATDADTKSVKALVFDSQYDTYRGVVVYIKLFSGTVKKGDRLRFIHTGLDIEATEVGFFAPKYNPSGILHEGEIGYVVTGLKNVTDAKVGDTLFA